MRLADVAGATDGAIATLDAAAPMDPVLGGEVPLVGSWRRQAGNAIDIDRPSSPLVCSCVCVPCALFSLPEIVVAPVCTWSERLHL